MRSAHLAIDLGASSGRAVLGFLGDAPKRIELHEVHRFGHKPIDTPAGLVWDFTGIVNEVLVGLKQGADAAAGAGIELRSVGVDTWGVDWSVVGPGGDLVGLPLCYRDASHAASKAGVLANLESGVEGLYRRTGVQPHAFNTLFQASGKRSRAPELFPEGGRLQLMPDLLHFLLCGETSHERTNASTGSWLSAESSEWDWSLLDSVGLPRSLFGRLIDPGTRLGRLRESLADALAVSHEIEVVAPATHDTASAIAAVPVTNRASESWAYLSSGTWSLLGMELSEPITSPEALAAGFTNELGVPRNGEPTVRFLRNIGGLWLMQELQRDLERGGVRLSFSELAKSAEASEPFRTLIDPNASDLGAPGESIKKLQGHARRTGQPVPDTPGPLARCCLESLALCYAESIDRLEWLTGRKIDALYVVGGGTQNGVLNRLTAAAIDRPMLLGPVEATSIGNLLVQAMGVGRVDGLDEVRQVVADSFPVEEAPRCEATADWKLARDRYASLTTTPD